MELLVKPVVVMVSNTSRLGRKMFSPHAQSQTWLCDVYRMCNIVLRKSALLLRLDFPFVGGDSVTCGMPHH